MIRLNGDYQMLAQSDTVTFLSQHNGKVCIRLYGRVSNQSTAGNASTVDIKLTRYVTGDYSNVKYGCYAKNASIGGDLSHSWSNSDYTSFYAGNEYTIFEKSFSVSHNADGTKSLTLTAAYDDSYIGALSIGAQTFELPPIARADGIGGVQLSGGAIEAGVAVTFVSHSSTFTHRLTLLAGGQAVAVRNSYASGQTVTLSAAELLALYRTGAMTLTVQLTTLQNGKDLGVASTQVTLSERGNCHRRENGLWRRGLVCVGGHPAVVMVKTAGQWVLAK